MSHTAEEERKEGHNEGKKSMGEEFKEFLKEEEGKNEEELEGERLFFKFNDEWKEFINRN